MITQAINALNCTHPDDTQILVCFVTSVLNTPCILIRAPETRAIINPHNKTSAFYSILLIILIGAEVLYFQKEFTYLNEF